MPPRAQLAGLAQVARIKSDLEMRKFAAFRAHVSALQQQADSAQAVLLAGQHQPAPASVADARLASARSQHAAQDLTAAEAELARLKDKFDAARLLAARAHGRASVLDKLAGKA